MTSRNFLLLLVVLPVLACTKEPFGRSYSWLKNGSAHKVFLRPYLRDSADAAGLRGFNPGDSVMVYETSNDGKEVSPSWINYLLRYDSVQVVYVDTTRALPPDTVRIGHLRPGVSVSYPKFIPATGARSLYNKAAWSQEILEENKNLLRGRFVYTFTEADYQAAR